MINYIYAFVLGVSLYLLIGCIVCWISSKSGTQKFSFKGVTFNQIITWISILFSKSNS